jgi:hypothetical protein
MAWAENGLETPWLGMGWAWPGLPNARAGLGLDWPLHCLGMA